ncbi:class I SAM-dependent DNA methyltransferase [Sporosarcina sp. YIM B06819]|uniref:class I SAM-dependent DNA methyltransferase n=1 Tax=Sporosarcina sp. YIM B06819 TaxID=3081769 RepID=UPI00298C43DA|nr:class I SAM-dependent DNA methyltransferase [Sporosarcina sp. YIM B06819]
MSRSILDNIIKRCTDTLRTDDGISGSMHYTETLSWILFLKFLYDKESESALNAEASFQEYNYTIDEKYHWDKWAKNKDLTGSSLIEFINDDLIPYLAGLKGVNKADRRDVISAIFSEVTNRVQSGYLLKDVLLEVDQIKFNSSDDIHTLSFLYESLLQKMGDDGGNSGEFYTPRPVVRFIVECVEPKIGNTILDPASGSCGFLAETYEYLKEKAGTSSQIKILSEETFFGNEKTSLAYLLGLMNMLLHGVDYPQIAKTNTLSKNIRQIEESEKYDVILSNPPFGGKEQMIVQQNFPIEATATELLFLQYIMKTLKFDGKAAVVVPEGVLFRTNDAYKQVKTELLEIFNVHSIVSLPSGVFLPYSGVKTSIIFFDKTKKTEDVWFYEIPLIKEKKLTKNAGISSEHFIHASDLFEKRALSEHSWLVPVEEILKNDTNLSASRYNPYEEEEEKLLEPEEYATEISRLLEKSLELITPFMKSGGSR